MTVEEQIHQYIDSQAEPKRTDLHELHQIISELIPGCKFWYLDGKDEKGNVVSNPNIGYGQQTMHYADVKSREFYQIGLSANTGGISVYILGLKDKLYLTTTFAKDLGKASVSGYCIKFKSLGAINLPTLKAAINYGINASE